MHLAGHVYYELYLVIALAGIALAVAIPRFQKEGLWGVVVGFAVTVAVIVIGGAILIYGLGALCMGLEKLEKFAFFRVLTATVLHLFRLLMLMGFAAFVWMLVAVRFGLDRLWDEKFVPIMSVGTGALLFVVQQFFRKTFWPVFLLSCGGLFAGMFGAVAGLLFGNWFYSETSLGCMDLGAVVAIAIYVIRIVKSRKKKADGPAHS